MVKVYDMVTYAVSEPDREVSLVLATAGRDAERMAAIPALALQEIELSRTTHPELPASMLEVHPDIFLTSQDKR